jgi:outer membrane biosynthesis protein TonB
VEADFVSAARSVQPPKVGLKMTNPRRREVCVAEPEEPTADEEPAPEPPAQAEPDPIGEAPPEASPAPTAAPAPSDAPPSAPTDATASLPSDSPTTAPSDAPAADASPAPAAPPIEVISGPAVPPPPPPPPQPGFSAVRDVALGAGVPDLVKGRRPVVPPLARMAGEGGEVAVAFSVDAGGVASVQKVDGPDLLKEAARQAVASWTFRRTTAERIFLAAVFTFEGDQARADVKRAE